MLVKGNRAEHLRKIRKKVETINSVSGSHYNGVLLERAAPARGL